MAPSRAWPPFLGHAGSRNGTAGSGPGSGPDDLANWSSLIGIVTAIVGNVLIALALNLQRYAHIRLHQQQQRRRREHARARKEARMLGHGPDGAVRGYGAVDDGQDMGQAGESDRLLGGSNGNGNGDGSGHSDGDNDSDSDSEAGRRFPAPTSYLRSPYWWSGQVLITFGEMGNFLAYGFAPASIVSPLGVVALISNCVIAPMLFKERFRVRDFWGVVVATGGVVTVVLSAKQQETKLAPHDVWDAITTTAFEIYAAVTAGLIALLMWASPRYGHRTILIDLGLVGLFGGYTVLATKGVSSMLSSTLLGAFTTPVTYVLLFILLSTAVMQVRYINKALQRFDSTQVIPVQFVMFTLSVIVGSAVLYRDFERTTADEAAKFVGGCLLTFFGVFIITSGRSAAPREDDENDALLETEIDMHMDNANGSETGDDGEGRARGRGQQGAGAGAEGGKGSGGLSVPSFRPPTSSQSSSRRSSRASHVGFADAQAGVPSTRVPRIQAAASGSAATQFFSDSEPLLANPWRVAGSLDGGDSYFTEAPRPGLDRSAVTDPGTHTVEEAVAASPAVLSAPVPPQTPNNNQHKTDFSTPPPRSQSHSRGHGHGHGYAHYQSPMFSPSPLLSSTVGAAMADSILKHMESSGGGGSHSGSSQTARRPSTRRARPGLRSSLFVLNREDGLATASVSASVLVSERRLGEARVDGQEDRLGLPENAEGSQHGMRDRARSLSNTIGELFWTRRRRRNTSPDTGSGGSCQNEA